MDFSNFPAGQVPMGVYGEDLDYLFDLFADESAGQTCLENHGVEEEKTGCAGHDDDSLDGFLVESENSVVQSSADEHPKTSGKSIKTLIAAGLYVENEDEEVENLSCSDSEIYSESHLAESCSETSSNESEESETSDDEDEGYGTQPTTNNCNTPFDDGAVVSFSDAVLFKDLDDDQKKELVVGYINDNPNWFKELIGDSDNIQEILEEFPNEIGVYLRNHKDDETLNDIIASRPEQLSTQTQNNGDVSDETDTLYQLLAKQKKNGTLSNIFKQHPSILGHALKSLDDDADILYKFLTKHRHVVGRFLNQHKSIEVLAEFLAQYPSALHQILDEERSIIENFLQQEPEALHIYLDAKPDVLRDYLAANPQKFHNYMRANPSILSKFCDTHPAFMSAWLQNRQAMVQDYLLANPALFWNHIAAHPACVTAGQTPHGRRFTASLLHDIPRDQEHLVRLPITWTLPKDEDARKKVLAQFAERGESEVAVQGSCQAGDAWINHESFVPEEELEKLSQEDHDWLNGHPDAQVPEALEWCTGKKFVIKSNKKTRKTRKVGRYQRAFSTVFQEVQPSLRERRGTLGGQSLEADENTRGPRPQSSLYLDIDAQTPLSSPTSSQSSVNQNFGGHQEETLDEINEMKNDNTRVPSDKVGKGKGKVVADRKGKGKATDQEDDGRSAGYGGCKDIDDWDKGYTTSSDDDEDQDFKPSESSTPPKDTAAGSKGHNEKSTKTTSRSSGSSFQNKQQANRASTKRIILDSDDDDDFDFGSKDEDTEDDDSDDFDASKSSCKRKKTSRRAPIQSDETISTDDHSSSTVTTASTSGYLHVPYPAPAQALAEDALRRRGQREWSLREEDCGIRHMLAVRDEGRITGEDRFREASERLSSELGVERTKISFKNFWNRSGRFRSGFDERRCKKAPLATSFQGRTKQVKKALQKKIASSRTTAAVASTGQAESSGAASARNAGSGSNEAEDRRIATLLADLNDASTIRATTSTPSVEAISAIASSNLNDGVGTLASDSIMATPWRSVNTPRPQSRSTGTPAVSPFTPEHGLRGTGQKRKSEDRDDGNDDIDSSITAFANGTRKKKKVNYSF